MALVIKLYLLERQDTPHVDEWSKVVVAAASETAARSRANSEAGSEGYVWTDGNLVAAKEIGLASEGVEGVVLQSRERDA